MTNRNRMGGISAKEAELIAAVSEKGLTVFSVEEASKLLGTDKRTVVRLANSLDKKQKIQRIERGKYLVIPPAAWKEGKFAEQGIVLASRLVNPYYISYWTALNLYGWTEQPSRTVFVATTKVKSPLSVQGTLFKFVELKASKFFGYTERWIGSQKVAIADKEKTIVDCLDQPRYAGEIVEVAKGLWNGREEIDFDKLLAYADRMNNGAIVKRLGFLMETLEVLSTGYCSKLKKRIKRGYVKLDTGTASFKGRTNSMWQLRVNVNPANLTEWRTH